MFRYVRLVKKGKASLNVWHTEQRALPRNSVKLNAPVVRDLGNTPVRAKSSL